MADPVADTDFSVRMFVPDDQCAGIRQDAIDTARMLLLMGMPPLTQIRTEDARMIYRGVVEDGESQIDALKRLPHGYWVEFTGHCVWAAR